MYCITSLSSSNSLSSSFQLPDVMAVPWKICVVCLMLATGITLTGCPAPVGVQTALEKQAEEITIVKNSYKDIIVKLLDTIEKLQLEILNNVELEIRSENYFKKEIGTDPTENTDPNLLIIPVLVDKELDEYFNEKRQQVRTNIAAAKADYLKLTESIENIEKINKAAKEYINSLVNLRRETKAMARTIVAKVSTVVPGNPIDLSRLESLLKIPNLWASPNTK